MGSVEMEGGEAAWAALDVVVMRTCVEVLEQTIRDIRSGHWMCGQLAAPAKISDHRKPLGCAIGLTGINSGAATISKTLSLGDLCFVASMRYPSESNGEWNVEGIKALHYLARAIPEQFKSNKDPHGLDQVESNIIEYNDRPLNNVEAEEWFTKAVSLARLLE